MEGSADRPGQGPRQGGLSDAGNVLDQKVAAREQRDDRVANGAGLAAQDASDVAFERGDQLCRRREPLAGRRIRLVATSWSDNPRKGGDTLAWLDRQLAGLPDDDRRKIVCDNAARVWGL